MSATTSQLRSKKTVLTEKVPTKSALQKKIEEDVLMASKVGDSVWLQQSLSTKQIPLDFTDKDVSKQITALCMVVRQQQH